MAALYFHEKDQNNRFCPRSSHYFQYQRGLRLLLFLFRTDVIYLPATRIRRNDGCCWTWLRIKQLEGEGRGTVTQYTGQRTTWRLSVADAGSVNQRMDRRTILSDWPRHWDCRGLTVHVTKRANAPMKLTTYCQEGVSSRPCIILWQHAVSWLVIREFFKDLECAVVLSAVNSNCSLIYAWEGRLNEMTKLSTLKLVLHGVYINVTV